MRYILTGIIMLMVVEISAQFNQFDYSYFNYGPPVEGFRVEGYPPVLINSPNPIISLTRDYKIDPKYNTRGTIGYFYINKEGTIDTVICGYPFFSYEDFIEYIKVARFIPGIEAYSYTFFTDAALQFRIRFLDTEPVTRIEIVYFDSVSIGLEDGSSKIVPLFDQSDYDLALGNAKFARGFRRNLDTLLEYVSFEILVDSILRINRLGRYMIPKRKGIAVGISGQLNREHFLLVNLRRNYYKVLDDLLLNLEPGDEYFLLCQKNVGAHSEFYITRFVLKSDLMIEPMYKKYTYSELRKAISINPKD